MKKNKKIIYNEIVNYVIVGGCTTFVGMFIFYGSVWVFLNGNDTLQLQIANIISWSGSVLFAYFANRKYVFKSTNKKVIAEMITFVSSRIITLLSDMGIMYFLTAILARNYNIAKLVSVIIVMVGNYVFSKMFVFRN